VDLEKHFRPGKVITFGLKFSRMNEDGSRRSTMKWKEPRKVYPFIFLVAMSVLAGAFAPHEALSQRIIGAPPPPAARFAVMPFVKGRSGGGMSDTLDAQISLLYFYGEDIAPDGARVLTEYVYQAVRQRHGDRVASLQRSLELYDQAESEGLKDTPRSLAQRLGLAMEANYILLGNVWRYVERDGGSWGVKSPASLGFAVYLMDVDDRKVVWSGSFDKTQRSLSENILEARSFFKEGGKWLSVEELALFGVKEVFEKYPF
jgi:hypothetical protein